MAEGQGGWADLGVTLFGKGVGVPVVEAGLPAPLETDKVVARAFLSSSLLLWSMSSISCSFCRGKLGIREGTPAATTDMRLELNSGNGHS